MDLTSQQEVPDCSGAAAMKTFVFEQRLYLIVAVFFDPENGGYAAPSLLYEISAAGAQPSVTKLQRIPTITANDVLLCDLNYAGAGVPVKFFLLCLVFLLIVLST